MRFMFTTAVAALIGAQIASAGELNRGQVSAEAAWMVHFDVEAAVGSDIGQYVIEHADELDIDMDDLSEIESELGMDPLRDLFGITIYGEGDPDEHCVAVISLSDAVESVIGQAEQETDHYRSMKVDGRTIHVWEEGDGPVFVHVSPGESVDRRILVVAGSVENVVEGVDVLEGGAPSLRGADQPLLTATPSRGSFVFAAATALPWLDWDDEAAAAIARRSTDIALDLGERDDSVYLDLSAATQNESDAANVADVVRGLLALGRLIADSDPDLAELKFMIDAIDVDADGNAIRIEMRQATEDVIEGLQAAGQ